MLDTDDDRKRAQMYRDLARISNGDWSRKQLNDLAEVYESRAADGEAVAAGAATNLLPSALPLGAAGGLS
jgi:hypothetical protein